ncbi:hypothetical protein VPH35_114720 [Triticum aestivum]
MKRCKRNDPAEMPPDEVVLPDELITEVLLRLPARSVLRFRAVCRAWSALLRSPGFNDAYAAAAAARRNSKFVFFAPTGVYGCSLQGSDALFTVDGRRLHPDFLCLSTRPCRGLLLFSDARRYGAYWVCNPSTGECRRLPQTTRRRPNYSSAGLVFDNQTKECKVVHLFHHGHVNISCEVYTLSGPNRRWRPAAGGGHNMPLPLQRPAMKCMQIQDTVTKMPPVFAGGYLHWLLYPNRQSLVPGPSRAAVLRFSVAGETFGIVNAPVLSEHAAAECRELEGHLPGVPIHLAELEGSLCMVHDRRHAISCLDIWVMRDHETMEWSLYCQIPLLSLSRDVPSPRFITILGLCPGKGKVKGERRIMLATSRHTVHSFCLEAGDVKTVLSVAETAIGCRNEAVAALQLALYEDSLVRIGDEDEEKEEQVLSTALTMALVRLPVRSIVQSMLVCKQWRTVIESESFVQSHMSISMSRPRRVCMVTDGRSRCNLFGFTPMEGWLQQQHDSANTPLRDKIICSKPCHGLNLISTGSGDDYMCNPCTGSMVCLGHRGSLVCHRQGSSKTKTNSWANNGFTDGRNVGLGFDESTGEHVAVEIGHHYLNNGSLACMVKTGSRDVWAFVGEPPVAVSAMPPAHISGTLYWLSEQTTRPCDERVVVAFDISARAFTTLPCHPCKKCEHDAFLVELNGMLSLVVADKEADELDVWVMMHRQHGTWGKALKICLRNQQPHNYYSLKTGRVVVPLQIDNEQGKILLSTGRALGYYHLNNETIETLYSVDELLFPMLYEESLICVPDDELLDDHHAAAPATVGHQGSTGSRSIFQGCEKSRCQGIAAVYRRCCRRVLCVVCAGACREHSRDQPVVLPTRWLQDVLAELGDLGLPLHHPFVPAADYCYYYSTKSADGDTARHVFVSVKDYARKRQPCHLVECGYRMEGQAIRETWVRRYRADDASR